MNELFGLRVRVAPFPLERQVPNRKHKKRHNQTQAYHRRIQKKWAKRWGTRTERYALMFNPAAAGIFGGSPTLALDPRDMCLLKGL